MGKNIEWVAKVWPCVHTRFHPTSALLCSAWEKPSGEKRLCLVSGKQGKVSLGPVPKGDLSFTYAPAGSRWKGLLHFFALMVLFSFPQSLRPPLSAQSSCLLSPLADLDQAPQGCCHITRKICPWRVFSPGTVRGSRRGSPEEAAGVFCCQTVAFGSGHFCSWSPAQWLSHSETTHTPIGEGPGPQAALGL